MPNHCENDLYIYGPKKERIRLARHVAGLPQLSETPEETDLYEELTSFRIPKYLQKQDKITKVSTLEDTEIIFDYGTIIPYPTCYQKLDDAAAAWDKKSRANGIYDWSKRPRDGFNQGGCDWCRANWGTKWNAYNIIREFRIKSLFYSFQSAWSPPIPVITRLAQIFPQLRIKLKYFERGMAYKGIFEVQGNRIIQESYSDYHGSRGG